jgi:hypothetical protein
VNTPFTTVIWRHNSFPDRVLVVKRLLYLVPLLIATAQLSAQPSRSEHADNIEVAERLIRIAYPEYGYARVVVVEDGMLSRPNPIRFTVELHAPDPSCSDAGEVCGRLLLTATFAFRLSVNLPNVLFISDVSREERAARFQRSVASMTWLNEKQRAEELRDYGGKYGSDSQAEFVRSLPLKELEDVFGQFDVLKVEYLDGDEEGLRDSWRMEIRTHLHGTDRMFILSLEPFDGKLTGVFFGG